MKQKSYQYLWFCLLWGVCLGLRAQEPAQLSVQMHSGNADLTLKGSVNLVYAIQAATNLPGTDGWVTLTNVVLPASPWLFIDPVTPGTARRFYRASALVTNVPAGMVLIPPGPFSMGDEFNVGYSQEWPTHTVELSAFFMDQYEATKALWDEVMTWAAAHGYSFDNSGAGKGPNHPVRKVSWHDAVKWCNARSEKEGRLPAYYIDQAKTGVYRTGQVNLQNDWVRWNTGYRLPTEAEWEKAARGGANGHRFSWSNVDTITQSQANYYSYWLEGKPVDPYDLNPTEGFSLGFQAGGSPYTSPIGSFAPNARQQTGGKEKGHPKFFRHADIPVGLGHMARCQRRANTKVASSQKPGRCALLSRRKLTLSRQTDLFSIRCVINYTPRQPEGWTPTPQRFHPGWSPRFSVSRVLELNLTVLL
jgi:formylglycine-generating enzyme required for sulfatase activity